MAAASSSSGSTKRVVEQDEERDAKRRKTHDLRDQARDDSKYDLEDYDDPYDEDEDYDHDEDHENEDEEAREFLRTDGWYRGQDKFLHRGEHRIYARILCCTNEYFPDLNSAAVAEGLWLKSQLSWSECEKAAEAQLELNRAAHVDPQVHNALDPTSALADFAALRRHARTFASNEGMEAFNEFKPVREFTLRYVFDGFVPTLNDVSRYTFNGLNEDTTLQRVVFQWFGGHGLSFSEANILNVFINKWTPAERLAIDRSRNINFRLYRDNQSEPLFPFHAGALYAIGSGFFHLHEACRRYFNGYLRQQVFFVVDACHAAAAADHMEAAMESIQHKASSPSSTLKLYSSDHKKEALFLQLTSAANETSVGGLFRRVWIELQGAAARSMLVREYKALNAVQLADLEVETRLVQTVSLRTYANHAAGHLRRSSQIPLAQPMDEVRESKGKLWMFTDPLFFRFCVREMDLLEFAVGNIRATRHFYPNEISVLHAAATVAKTMVVRDFTLKPGPGGPGDYLACFLVEFPNTHFQSILDDHQAHKQRLLEKCHFAYGRNGFSFRMKCIDEAVKKLNLDGTVQAQYLSVQEHFTRLGRKDDTNPLGHKRIRSTYEWDLYLMWKRSHDVPSAPDDCRIKWNHEARQTDSQPIGPTRRIGIHIHWRFPAVPGAAASSSSSGIPLGPGWTNFCDTKPAAVDIGPDGEPSVTLLNILPNAVKDESVWLDGDQNSVADSHTSEANKKFQRVGFSYPGDESESKHKAIIDHLIPLADALIRERSPEKATGSRIRVSGTWNTHGSVFMHIDVMCTSRNFSMVSKENNRKTSRRKKSASLNTWRTTVQ